MLLEEEAMVEEPVDENLPMNEEELAEFLSREYQNSIGVESSEISYQRANSMERYNGMPYGDEVPGRSTVISTDVREAVEMAMPQLMEVFHGGETVAEMDPEGPEDIAGAEAQTAYLNYVYLRKNNGFTVSYQFIKDALLQKDGIVKVWVEPVIKDHFEEYVGLTEGELQSLLVEPNVELVENTPTQGQVLQQDPQTGQTVAVPVTYYDVKIRVYEVTNEERVDLVPPEELKVSKRTRNDLQKSPYVAHWSEYTKSQLTQLMDRLGSDLDPDEVFLENQNSTSLADSPERLARHSHDGTEPDGMFGHTQNTVWVGEEYVMVDANGDGYDERLKVFRVGKRILFMEEYPRVPFAHSQIIIQSHMFNGISLADLVEDLAKIKTALSRNILDNIYRQNNGRVAVLDGQVEMDDLLVSRPGGVIREFVTGAVRPLQEPQLPSQAFDLLGYFDQVRDERTGLTKLGQGLDPNALSSNVATGAISQVMGAAQQRIKLMARVLAEGFRQIFWLLHEESRHHVSGDQKFQFSGQQYQVDPSRFLERKDYTVRVGLGNIERDADLARLGLIAQDMQMIAAQGGVGRLLQEQNVYALAAARAKAAGIKDYQMFYTDPAQLPPPEEGPKQYEIDAQMEAAKQQHEQALKQMEIESKERIEAVKAELKAQEIALKDKELELEAALELRQGRGVSLND